MRYGSAEEESVKRLALVGCVLAAVLGGSLGSCAGQVASDKSANGKAASSAAKSVKKGASVAAPQPARTWTSAELGGTREPYAEITLAVTGKPLLAIHYPWQAHERPSVEVRVLSDDEPDSAEIRPLLFVGSLMKGEIASAVYECRDKAAQTPQKKTVRIQNRDFEMLADRNLLTKPATTVVLPERPTKDGSPERGAGIDGAARAVFFLLESWSVDSRTLWLELPPGYFAKPGRLRVWFLRQGNPVWWKTLAWPGLK